MPRHRRLKAPWENRLLVLFFNDEEAREKLEDLADVDEERGGRTSSWGRDRLRHILQVFRLIGARFELSVYWGLAMIRNYLTIAWRNLVRSKTTAFITLFGLSLGITGFLLVSVWALGEFGFDRFHENAASIFRIEERRHLPDRVEPGSRTPGLLAAALKDSYPEVRRAVRVAWTGERVVRHGEEIHYEENILCVDPPFLSLFSFPLSEGHRETALGQPHAMVITESFGRKYFGSDDPIGEVLTVDGKMSFEITGILEDVPTNSHLQFEALVPFEVVEELGWMIDTWSFSIALTYVELEEGVDQDRFEAKIAGFVKDHDTDSTVELTLNPLTRIRLYSSFDEPGSPGRIRYVLVSLLVGILILFIACVNFINLSTARSEQRAREIGLRKVIGAAKRDLVRQFLLEAVFIALLSLLFAPPLLKTVLPAFNEIAGSSLTWANFLNSRALLLAAGIVLATGLFSGIYPAVFLSSFDPVRILKGRAAPGPAGSFLRKTLVLVQVGASVGLLITASAIYLQIDFLRTKDLGFDKERLISIPLGISNPENPGIYRRLKNTLLGNPRILGVSGAFTHPTQFGTRPLDGVFFESRRLDEEADIAVGSVESGFIETLGIQLVSGRPFSDDSSSERGRLLANEAFQELLGVESALGRTVRIGPEYSGTIAGVMADFHMESPAAGTIGPLLLFQNPAVNYIFVRLGPGDVAVIVEEIGKAWREAAPGVPFKFGFLDEDFDLLYQDLDHLASMIRIFTLVAAFIAALGLFGLASHAAEQRAKEIGIRKVLGSTAGEIWMMLSGDFVRLVFVACLVAWPVAWFVTRNWLADFPYRITLGWEVFVLSGLLAVTASLGLVSFHTLRASRADPVEALRTE